jgi:hypothetical protein
VVEESRKSFLDSLSPLLGFLATQQGMMGFRSAFFVLIPSDLCNRCRPHPRGVAVIILFFLLWLLPEDEINGYRSIGGLSVEDCGRILLMLNGTRYAARQR